MTTERGDAAVEFESVTKRYGEVVAVRSVSFRIEPGNLVTLLGPSGCGKTTTLRMIAGLESASEGTIRIAGRDVTSLPATDRDVSMVFQSYALFPHMSVLDNVAYGLVMSKSKRDAAESAALEALELVGLGGFGSRMPSELSGGQQQRVAVARALVLKPKVLLFDEPLSNLDARLRRKMREDIRSLQQKLGLSSVYVTHDQEEALAVSDRIIVMDRAEIVQEGTPRELYEAPRSEFVASFMGEANILDGEVMRTANGTAFFGFEDGTFEVVSRGAAVGSAKLAVRPRAIELYSAAEGGEGTVTATVEAVTYLGSHVEYRIATKTTSLFAISYELGRVFEAGQQVRVGVAERGVILL